MSALATQLVMKNLGLTQNFLTGIFISGLMFMLYLTLPYTPQGKPQHAGYDNNTQ